MEHGHTRSHGTGSLTDGFFASDVKRVLLGGTGFDWVLTGFYWVLLGFTGFTLALSGFTGLHQVSPGF